MKLNIPREKRSVELWNVCECGEVLHSISEGERGTCSLCWVKSLTPERRKAMNNLLASAFNGSTDAQKEVAVEEAFKHFREGGK